MPRTRRRQRGAGPWREGADTCVFNPALACTDSPASRPGPEYVSRVTDPTDRALAIETLIKEKFPKLVSKGWVTAFEKACTPFYNREDSVPDPSYVEKYISRVPKPHPGACQTTIVPENRRAAKQINLISKRVGPSFHDFIVPTRIDSAFLLFRNAMSAAVALVPDEGPWIIHTDLHTNNILRSLTEPSYMLHDWGRSLVIRDPRTPEGILQGVKEFVDEVYPPAEWDGKIPVGWQLPKPIVDAAQRIYDSGNASAEDAAKLRVWTIIVVFKNILEFIATPINTARIPFDRSKKESVIEDIFVYLIRHTRSQKQLGIAINEIVTKLTKPAGTQSLPYILLPNADTPRVNIPMDLKVIEFVETPSDEELVYRVKPEYLVKLTGGKNQFIRTGMFDTLVPALNAKLSSGVLGKRFNPFVIQDNTFTDFGMAAKPKRPTENSISIGIGPVGRKVQLLVSFPSDLLGSDAIAQILTELGSALTRLATT